MRIETAVAVSFDKCGDFLVISLFFIDGRCVKAQLPINFFLPALVEWLEDAREDKDE